MSGGRTESIGSQSCKSCTYEFPEDREQCPHCGRPHLFPNVKIAERPDEQSALETRFQDAIVNAGRRNCRSVVDDFYVASSASKAVICCKAKKLLPLATGDQDLYANFYAIEKLRFTPPTAAGETDWNTARIKAEIDLLGSSVSAEKLHYAVLSLDQFGASYYGEYALVLRDDMIEHRASAFQENSGVYFRNNPGAAPKGFRSNWDERGKLCVAKIEPRLNSGSTAAQFPTELVKPASTTVDDDFVEVQVFGEMTVRTFERVTRLSGTKSATAKPTNAERAAHLAIEEYFSQVGITVEQQP